MNLERYLALTPFGDSLKQRDSVELQISQTPSCFVRRVQMVCHSNVSPQFCLELTRNTASKLVQIMTVFETMFAIQNTVIGVQPTIKPFSGERKIQAPKNTVFSEMTSVDNSPTHPRICNVNFTLIDNFFVPYTRWFWYLGHFRHVLLG